MHLPDGSPWHLAMNSLDFLRMPVFTVLSGYFYASHRAEWPGLPDFFRKKAARLVLPWLFVTAAVFVIRQRVYHDDLSLMRALFFHYQHLWFLQALILIFLVVGLWDATRRPDWIELCMAGLAAVMVSRAFMTTTFLSVNGALYLLPFFVMGMVLRTEGQLLAWRDLSKLAVVTVAIVLATQQATHALGGTEPTRFGLPAALCGICGAYLLLAHCPRVGALELVGRYSYTIFLWHSVAASGARQAVRALVTLPVAAEFALLLAVGVLAPIALHLVVSRIPLLSLLAAGVRTSPAGPGKGFALPRVETAQRLRAMAFTVGRPTRRARDSLPGGGFDEPAQHTRREAA